MSFSEQASDRSSTEIEEDGLESTQIQYEFPGAPAELGLTEEQQRQLDELMKSATGQDTIGVLHALPHGLEGSLQAIFNNPEKQNRWFSETGELLSRLQSHEDMHPEAASVTQGWTKIIVFLRHLIKSRGLINCKEVAGWIVQEWDNRVKFLREYFNNCFEELFNHANVVNEGNNGIILKLSLDEVASGVLSGLRARGVDLLRDEDGRNNTAVKLLKVYRKGLAESEFTRQQRAFKLINESSQPRESLALVAEPLLFSDLTIEEDLEGSGNKHDLARLQELGFPTRTITLPDGREQQCAEGEFIVMDYLQGKDLATYMYEWIIAHAPEEKQYLLPNTQFSSFNELARAVYTVLDLPNPTHGESEQIRNNAKKIFAELERTGFQINKHIIDQLSNTIRIFEQGKLALADAHERNIFVVGEPADVSNYHGDHVQSYILDFGATQDDMMRGYDELLPVLKQFAQKK